MPNGPNLYNGQYRGVVTLCFNDSGMFRPGIDPRSPAREVNSLPLSHLSGSGSMPYNVANGDVWFGISQLAENTIFG